MPCLSRITLLVGSASRDIGPTPWPALAVATIVVIGLGFVWTFAIFTSTSWISFPKFVVATVFLFLLPGGQIVRWCGLHLSTIEHATLSAVLGMVCTCLVYAVLTWLGVSPLIYVWVVAALIGLAWTWRPASMAIRDKFLATKPVHLFLLLALIVSWIPIYVLPFYYRNLSLTGTGGLSFVPLADVLFHTALAGELTHTFPPQIPFIAGEPLSYHVGMDLVAAVLNRIGGIPIADLVVRYCPTMFITMDVLAVFCLARGLIGSGGAAVTAAVLATVAEDLSFIPGVLQNSDQLWIVHYFAAPTVVSLYFLNPMVMAHGLLFTSLFCLQRAIAEPRWGWAIAAALCCAALAQTKVFVFVQLSAALAIAIAINFAVYRRWMFLKESLAIGLISAPLVLYTMLANTQGGQISWTWSSGLESYVQNAFRAASWPLLATYPLAGLIVYLALTFGFRIVGIGELIKSFHPAHVPAKRALHPHEHALVNEPRACSTSKGTGHALARLYSLNLLLAVFVILGPLVTLTTKLVPHDVPDFYNEAIWFTVASKYVAALFAVMALAKWWDGCGWTARAFMIAVTAVISLASTIQYLGRLSAAAYLDEMPPALTETAAFLDRVARPGQVAIMRRNESILALTKLRIPVYSPSPITVPNVFRNTSLREPYLTSRDILVARTRDIDDFWRSWGAGTVRDDILRRYGVDWIVASRSETPAALGGLPSSVFGNPEIRQEFTNREFIIFRVRQLARAPRASKALPSPLTVPVRARIGTRLDEETRPAPR
jgi:hypothetical protein